MFATQPTSAIPDRRRTALAAGLALLLLARCGGGGATDHAIGEKSIEEAETEGVRPEPPASLTALADTGQVSLTWDTPAGATGFEVFRAVGIGAKLERIATPSVPSFTDRDVVAWTDYVYAVRATNGFGVSDNSAEITATPRTSVYAGSFTIRSADDAAYLKPVTRVTGDLVIQSETLRAVTLPNLVVVNGVLAIASSAALTTLSMPALITIGKDLEITGNAKLSALTGLKALASVGRDLTILDNASLTNLTGLEALPSIGRNLTVSANPLLTGLKGLEQVSSLGGSLEVSYSPAVTDLSGLASLQGPVVDLIVKHNGNSLTSLAGLAGVTAVRRDLDVRYNPALTTVAALSSVTAVTGYIEMGNNPALASLELNALKTVGGYFYLDGDTALTSLTGLSELSVVKGALGLAYSAVSNLDGLQALTTVGGGLVLQGNPNLTDVSAMTQLSVVGDPLIGLMVVANPLLTSLNGFSGVTTLGGPLRILNNPMLTDIDGLSNLASGQDIVISGNNALVSLGLSSLTGTVPSLTVLSNPELCETVVTSLLSQVTVSGSVNIAGNKGC